MVPGQLNVVQDFGLTWTVQRLIGSARTFEMAFSGTRLSAEQVEAWGLVNGTFPTVGELVDHVDKFARQIGDMGSDAVRMLKTVLRNGAGSSLRDQLRLEAISNGLCFQSDEFRSAKADMLHRVKKG